MRLCLCLLLLTLALCCYEANAKACPSLASEMKTFLNGTDTGLKIKLAKFNAPKEEVGALLEAKKCTDGMPSGDRQLIIKTVGQILSNCQ
ncbi:secretoglobin family 1D member 1-like [Cynocephalus volans]|uniref:secretoglobin family 1D member 1-like n=1 Tax=Cynocephalus volans TaxID=110931 RepID=UPI002FC7A3FA